jgi:hypothetical protein
MLKAKVVMAFDASENVVSEIIYFIQCSVHYNIDIPNV